MPLLENTGESSLSVSLSAMERYKKMAFCCKQVTGLSKEVPAPWSSYPLIQWEINIGHLSHLVCGIFVIVTPNQWESCK